MKFGVPWGAKNGIRPDARETAMEAARRSGMSLDDWLNSVIMHQAAQAGVQPQAPAAARQTGRQGQKRQKGQPDAPQPDSRQLAAVNNRLDDLSRRIEQFTRAGAAAPAPQRPVQSHGPDPRAELIGRLDRYVHNAPPQGQPAPQQPIPRQMPPRRTQPAAPAAMDQALADIAARKQMLSGGGGGPQPPRRASSPADYAPPAARAQQVAAQAAAQAPAPAQFPAQDLSGLEAQLRKITDQIETLRQPGVEQAINALRAELGEIGHALGEAMPRHSIETIEHQIQGLTQRIAEGRQNGVDHNALAGIEHGLGEVRDALHGLTPAENLIGFNDAVHGLAQKIDLIVAQKDPESMAQLETAITTLRSMANHVASNDAVGALAAEVQALADKVDYIARASANTDALSSLEARIDALGQALAERAQAGNAVPPRLEALVQSLADKIEQIQTAQQTHGDAVGGQLDDRISTLLERLDASDSRLGQLEAVERGLADLLMHIEQQQSTQPAPGQGGDAMAVDALKHDFAQAQESLKYDLAQAQEALKSDLTNSLAHSLAHSQDEIKGDIARTQNALDQVHGTLGELVGRLATIEQSIRSETRAEAPAPAPAYADAGHGAQFAYAGNVAHETAYAHDEEPLELTHPIGKVAARLVEDAAPGMSAFDGMLPPRSAEAPPAAQAASAPVEHLPVEPEPFAPSIQPEPAPMMAAPEPERWEDAGHAGDWEHLDHAGHLDDAGQMEAMESAETPHPTMPRAPQLEAQLEALRARAATSTFAPPVEAPQVEAPRGEAPVAEAPQAPQPRRMAPGHGPINPDLPPDEPLEPGSGPPTLRAHAGARIGASEVTSNHAGESADEASGGKLSFIAAARRAAQAAMQQEPAPPPMLEADDEEEAPEGATHPLRKKMLRRVKSLFVAASIVAIVVGGVQIAATYFKVGAPASRTTQRHPDKTSQRADSGAETANAERARQAANSAAAVTSPARIAATPLALMPPSTSIDLLAPPDRTVHIATIPTPDPRRVVASAARNTSSPDITGSIPQAGANRSALAPAAANPDLPLAIGGPQLRQAAAAGNGAAAYEVAMRFAEGRRVPANLSTAARWYERAASKGLAPAEFRLASLFEKGQGVKKNLARARALYFAAARQGHAKAMHNLAVLYAEGVDGKPDYTTAVQWFRDAAEHGVSDSQYNLGVLYARGIGVDKDLPESYKWFALAAKHGDKEAARKRDEVASRLDKNALAAARQAVAKFVPRPQPQQATTVPAPPGGWDKAAAAPAARTTARAAQAFPVGKR